MAQPEQGSSHRSTHDHHPPQADTNHPPDAPALRHALTTALLAADHDRAKALLQDIPPQGDAQLDTLAARLYIAWRHWQHAAAVLPRITPAPADAIAHRTQLNLARNLAAIQLHLPDLYHTLADDTAPHHHQLHLLPCNRLTILRTRPGHTPTLLSTGTDPATEAARKFTLIKPALDKAIPLALNGTGDGYLLPYLATCPTLPLGQQSAIHIFEPHTDALLHALMIHDYTRLPATTTTSTATTSPATDDAPCHIDLFQQKHFTWHVGRHWQASYTRAMRDDLTLPPPATVVNLSNDADQLTAFLDAHAADTQAQSDQFSRTLHQRYDHPALPATFAALCAPNPPRQPRALLITSRFTAVLQHETTRIARALEALGWQTAICIEKQNHLRTSKLAMQQLIHTFNPDLCFTIDHLRHEHRDIIPQGLPYICWVQDLLEHLTTPDAGRTIDSRQWVLTFCKPLLTTKYAYPPDRCIDVPIMLASDPAPTSHQPAIRPAAHPTAHPAAQSSSSDQESFTTPHIAPHPAPQLAYVSNLSLDAPALITATVAKAAPAQQHLTRLCADAIAAHYARGRSLPGITDIASFIAPILHPHWRPNTSSQDKTHATIAFARQLWNPLNIALYRQQALTWIADHADARNLSLAIFGRGWEQHPRFAKYAKGTITPGPQLNALIQATTINLNLEPYPCTTHIRLLDGLTAGGFYLIRQHPADITLPQLAALLHRHAPSAQTDTHALRAVSAHIRPQLQSLITAAASISYDHPPDVVAQLRSYQNARVISTPQTTHHTTGATDAASHALLPDLAAVSFHDTASAAAAIDRFIHDAPARAAIAARQRIAVLHRLTLTQGLSRILNQIASQITPPIAPPATPSLAPSPAPHITSLAPSPAAPSRLARKDRSSSVIV